MHEDKEQDWSALSPRERGQTRDIIGNLYPHIEALGKLSNNEPTISAICRNYLGRMFLRQQLKYYAISIALAGGAVAGLSQIISGWEPLKMALRYFMNRL